MVKVSGLILTFYIVIAVIILSIITSIIIYSPFYSGFEAQLNYLSPDLSENRTVIRDSVTLKKPSKIKIVFENKESSIIYSKEDFLDFINNLELEIWNDNEYFSFHNKDLIFFEQTESTVELLVGEIKGDGKYSIYINSDFAVNPTYHIGIGIGREKIFPHIGHNRRNFY